MEEQERQPSDVQPDPELLYHYTDQKGLLGIIENRCIWATHSQFLNDISEYRIIFDALRGIVQEELNNDRNENWANLLSALLKARQIRGVFVSSFSGGLDGDSLAMWRAYMSNIGGYSIGFDRLALKSLADSFFPAGERGLGTLNKCFYLDPEDLKIQSSLKDLIGIILPNFVNPPKNFSESDWNDPTSIFRRTPIEIMEYVDLQASIAACGKHIGFKVENEWRIILVDEERSISKRDKFRQGKSMLVPYVEIDWKGEEFPSPIRRIVVGPTPNRDEAVKAIEMLLDKEGVPVKSEDSPDGVEVVSSKIPYRNW